MNITNILAAQQRGLETAAIALFLAKESLRYDPIHEGRHISEWLGELVDQKSPERARSAAQALRRAGPEAAPFLLAGLNEDSKVRNLLWRYTPRVLQTRLSAPPDPSVLQANCAAILGDISPTSPQVVRALVGALRSGEAPVDFAAAMALRRIAGRDEEVANELKRDFPEMMAIEGNSAAASLEVMNAIRAYQAKAKAQ